MGTAKTVPYWVAEIQLMEQFTCTEKQLYEEFSTGTIQRVGVLNELRAKAAKFKERQLPRPPKKPLRRR